MDKELNARIEALEGDRFWRWTDMLRAYDFGFEEEFKQDPDYIEMATPEVKKIYTDGVDAMAKEYLQQLETEGDTPDLPEPEDDPEDEIPVPAEGDPNSTTPPEIKNDEPEDADPGDGAQF